MKAKKSNIRPSYKIGAKGNPYVAVGLLRRCRPQRLQYALASSPIGLHSNRSLKLTDRGTTFCANHSVDLADVIAPSH
jgi:hypothetical protein